MRGWEGQVVSPLSHIFLRNFTGPCGLVFVGLVGCVVFWFVLVCFFGDGLVKILHSISTSSFHVSSSWPTMLRARSAMQEKKAGGDGRLSSRRYDARAGQFPNTNLHLSSTCFETRRITTRTTLAIQVHTCATRRDIQFVFETGLDHVAMMYQ